jgi:hypothetical protein
MYRLRIPIPLNNKIDFRLPFSLALRRIFSRTEQ